jgi:arginyl-tRNA--protein-N-Asp/Glu arginylyltransferase
MASAVSFLTTVSQCEYLPDQIWQLRYDVGPHLHPADYMQRLQQGWRRFGYAMFRPTCPSCRMCQPLRVPATTFRPNPSQRRAWKRNQGHVTVHVGVPILSPDRLDLWTRFHRHGHAAKGWPADVGGDPGLLLENPFHTEEWTYYVGNRLIAVAYVDALPEALSAIYCYYDPTEAARSPGTFNILSLLAAARERGLPHVYLGYYVAGCRSMAYKRQFRPNEVLGPHGLWEAFDVG